MPSSSQSKRLPVALDRAMRLKRELAAFATSGPLKSEYEQHKNMLFGLSHLSNEHEEESVLDWFLFEWIDDGGGSVIEYFLKSRPDLSDKERSVLIEWETSINSIFEIDSLGKGSLKLRDMDSRYSFSVKTNNPSNRTTLKRGQFLAARLLPLGDSFIFAGPQFPLPDRESALEALEMRRALDEMGSPEAIEQAQQAQCSAFCELFGCTELTVPSNQLNATLERLQQYVFFERRDPETKKTLAENFQSNFGVELRMLDMPEVPERLVTASEVTILCDEFDGIVVLPDYNRFRRVFEASNPDRAVPEWRDVVWNYIKNPDIPIVAFERVAERHSDRVEKLLGVLLEEEDFSIKHLYAVLLHYKQPVEGLDGLEEERRLWDLFDGGGGKKSAEGRSRAMGNKKSSSKKVSSKKTSSAKNKTSTAKPVRSAKKTTPSKLAAKGAKAASRKATAKTPSSKPRAKAKPASNKKARNSASAKKR